jgi:Mor family transcriptional regulator
MVKTTTLRTQKNQTTPEHVMIDFDALHMVKHTDDVVEYTLRCVLALTPRLEKAVIEAAEKQVRDVFGGDRLYVARRPGESTSQRNEEIRRLHQNGERVSYLERKFKLSARQIYRIIEDSL